MRRSRRAAAGGEPLQTSLQYEMMPELDPDTRPPLPAFAVQRLLTDRLLTFVEVTGIADLLRERQVATVRHAFDRLGAELGYRIDDPGRARMLRVLIDFLGDCGLVTTQPDGAFRWNAGARRPWRATPADVEGIGEAFDGEVEFFAQCLDYAGRFLAGEPPLFDFVGGSVHAWERLLGNRDFAFARSVVARLLLPRAEPAAEILVLCYGPGYDLVEIEKRRPDARVTALDFTDGFLACASGRLGSPRAVRWVEAARWNGFGSPLPFADSSFQVVVFSCANPYIPATLRESVYRDIFRVVKPGGVLGMLTYSYPDVGRREVADEWVRRGIYCHDFLESVCKGWQGFYPADETRRMLSRVGFGLDVVTLNASVWRLRRPEAR